MVTILRKVVVVILVAGLIFSNVPCANEVEAEDSQINKYEEEDTGSVSVEGKYIAGEEVAFSAEGFNLDNYFAGTGEEGDTATLVKSLMVTGPEGFIKIFDVQKANSLDGDPTEQEDEYDDQYEDQDEETYDGEDSPEDDNNYESEDMTEDDYYDFYNDDGSSDSDDQEDAVVLEKPGKYTIEAVFDKYSYKNENSSESEEENSLIEQISGAVASLGAAVTGNKLFISGIQMMNEMDLQKTGEWIHEKEVKLTKIIKVKGKVIFDPVAGKNGKIIKYIVPLKNLGKMTAPEWKGHRFDGWYTEKNKGKKVSAKTKIRFNGQTTRTYFAHWTGKTRILFKPGKGHVSKKVKKVWRDGKSKYGKLPKAKRKGHKFKGWYTKKKGGKKIYRKTRVPDKAKVKVYAHWIGKTRILFKPGKGHVSKKVKRVWRDGKSRYGKLPKAKRKGYTFKGWYTRKSGGKKVYRSTKVPDKAKVKLYAHWKKKPTRHRSHVEYVYITATGKRYHSSPSCRGLSRARNIWPVPASEAEAMGLTHCELCY